LSIATFFGVFNRRYYRFDWRGFFPKQHLIQLYVFLITI
jgi:hypothetical protein